MYEDKKKCELSFDVKQAARQELKSYTYLTRAIKNLENQIQLLDDDLSGKAVNFSNFGIKGSVSMEDILINKIATKEEIQKTIDYSKKLKQCIKDVLESMNAEDRDLLVKKYVRNMTCERICASKNIDKSWMCRKLDKAMKQYVYFRFGVTDEKDIRKLGSGVIDCDLDIKGCEKL